MFRRELWKKAREIIRSELAKSPEDHWLLTRLAMTYYEERQYVSALKYVEQASKIMPKCPLVIWDHASILDMLRREKAAIALWKKLIRRGGRSIAFDECGEGLRWPRSLINDCNYRIGKSYYDLGNERLARAFITKHLKGRQPGLRSLYEAKRVRKEFSGL